MQLNPKVLIIDDDRSIRMALSMTLEDSYSVLCAGSGAEALKLLEAEKPDLVLLDIGLPDMNGVEILKRLKAAAPETEVLIITAAEDVRTVVEAVKLGAYDYLVKPLDSQNLFLSVHNALEHQQLKHQLQLIQKPSKDLYRFDLIDRSPEIKAVIDVARKAATSPETPVLISGETGAGKGVMAKAIHYSGTETPGPFVTVNCGAISANLIESELFGYEKGAFTGATIEGRKGRFEEAAEGTLFLDEIGAMPLDAQVKLLGVLEDRLFYRVGGSRKIQVSARIIAATNINLEAAVAEGKFRPDLYYRLNVIRMVIPPLRDRRDDIILLATFFMNQFNIRFGRHFRYISPEARDLMLNYPWPGNVRELRNLMERIILLQNDDTIVSRHLPEAMIKNSPPEGPADAPLPETDQMDYDSVVRNLILKALDKSRGNVLEAAHLLNMPVHRLRYRIKKLDIQRPSCPPKPITDR